MLTKNKNQQGFTLIELLVVISIIALIAAIGTVALLNARKESRDSKRKDDVSIIRQALEWYLHENGVYPNGGAVGNPNQETDIQALSGFLTPKFMNDVPDDPKNNPKNYMYAWKNNGQDYGLLVPYGNDGGQDCKWMTPNGNDNWFKVGAVKVPNCTY